MQHSFGFISLWFNFEPQIKSELAGKSNLTNKEAWTAYLAIQSSSAHDHLKSQQRIYSKNTGTFLLQLSSCGHCCQGARPHPPASHLATKMEYWVHVKQVAKHFPLGSVPISSGQDFDSVQGESFKLSNLSQDESRAEGQFLNFLQHVCKRRRLCSVGIQTGTIPRCVAGHPSQGDSSIHIGGALNKRTKGSCPETSPLVPNPTPGSWSYVPLKIHWRIAVSEDGLSVDIHKQFIAHIVGSIVLHSISNNLCELGNSQTCCAVLLYRSLPVLVHLLLFAVCEKQLTLPKT